MATTVNKEGIGEVYGVLEEKIKKTLDYFIENYTMTELQKAQVLSNAILALVQTSAQQVQQQPLIDVQVSQATVQTNSILKDIELKTAQISQATIQTNSILKDILVKEVQATLIGAQTKTEATKQALSTRQTAYYTDQLKIEKSKHYSTMTMGALQTGTTVPADLWTATFTAANNLQ